MGTTNPLVTVLIPMRNAEPFVGATLESVLRQSQDGVDLDVVVVDDGSTDRSAEVVRAFNDPRVRIIPGPQSGISAAFNAGLAAARGTYLARCDADDLYPAGRLAWQLEFLGEHPEFGAVSGSFATVTHQGKFVAERKVGSAGEEVTAELQDGRGRSHLCAYLIRTDALREIGGCRTYFKTSEDADLQYRLAERTRVWYDPTCAYLYRLHDASITHRQASPEREFFEDIAREFQKQRRARGRDDLEDGRAPAPPTVGAADAAPQSRSAAEQIQRLLLGEAWQAHAEGRRGRAVWSGLRACAARPLAWAAWKSLLALAVKPVPPPPPAATPRP